MFGLFLMLLFLLLLIVGGLAAIVALSLVQVPANKYLALDWSFPFLFRNPPKGHFIAVDGENGIRARIYGPGWHFIPLVRLFAKLLEGDFLEVSPGYVGIIEAFDGEPLTGNQVVAEHQPECNLFADGEAFIMNHGQRGFQVPYLPPGTYLINAHLFRVHFVPLVEIPEGFVGVVISNCGGDPAFPADGYNVAMPGDDPVYVVYYDRVRRGVLQVPLGVGKHPVNTAAFKVILVDTTPVPVAVDGATENRVTGEVLEPVTATTSDGFTIPVQMEAVIRVTNITAPGVVALAGSVAGLIQDVVVPMVDDAAKRLISQRKLEDLVAQREEVRHEIEQTLVRELEGRLPVQVITFRVIKIDFEGSPDMAVREFMDQRTRVVRAAQELKAVTAELEPAKRRVELAFQQALAANQTVVARAALQAQAAGDTATAMKTLLDAMREAGIKESVISGPVKILMAHPEGLPAFFQGLTRVAAVMGSNPAAQPLSGGEES